MHCREIEHQRIRRIEREHALVKTYGLLDAPETQQHPRLGDALAQSGKPHRTLEPEVTIHYSDLNLSSPQGARVLYARIRTAAQRVCGPSFSLWDSSRSVKWKLCYAASIDTAVKKVNQPLLTALHERLSRGRERKPSVELARH